MIGSIGSGALPTELPWGTALLNGKSESRIVVWATTATENPLKFGNKKENAKTALLASIDPFFNWKGLNLLDFTKKYSYEFVIYDEKNKKLIDNFIFPINPQRVDVNVPAAVNTTVSLKGILEEYNGAPLRYINISGTTGIASKSSKDSSPKPDPALAVLEGIGKALFKDTIKAVESVKKNVESTINTLQTAISGKAKIKYFNNITWDQKEYDKTYQSTTGGTTDTGYQTLHNLARFLDFYLAKKKTSEGKNLRLVLHMHKDKMYYDVTLNNFSFNKPPGSIEYLYSMSMTAWKRRKDPVGTERKPKTISLAAQTDLSLDQKINLAVNTVKKGRKTIAEAAGVLSAIKSDTISFFNTINEVIMFSNDLGGLIVQTADLIGLSPYKFGFVNPENSLWALIDQEWKKSIALNQANPINNDAVKKLENAEKQDSGYEGVTSFDTDEGLTDLIKCGNGRTVGIDSAYEEPDFRVADDLDLNPESLITALENVSVSDLNSPLLDRIVEEQMEEIRKLTAEDFRSKRDYIAKYAADVEKYLSESANSETGIDTSNVEILYSLNETILSIDTLISAIESSSSVRENDYNAFYRDFAISNGIDFANSQSKFYVPFPFGSSLEVLALNYLGNQDRWIEIAALNGLKAPYIDEDGVEVRLTNSAIGNSITVSDISNLYIGQVVKVLSDTKKPVVRKIRSIDQYSSIESIINFEPVGGESLSGYKASENARIKTFLPNTVNSLKLIAIPSQESPTINGKVRLGAQIEDLNGIARTAKTDFLLNSAGDIVFTTGGDVKTAEGLTNLIQAALIKLRTKPGFLVQHPEFGAAIDPGTPTSEIDLKAVYEFIQSSFAEDERFSGILSSQIEKVGNSVTIKLLLGIAGSDSLLPLETSIPL